MPSRDLLLQTATSLIKSYETWDIDTILAPRSPDCIQHILPASRGHPPRTNDEYRAFFAQLRPHFRNFTVIIKDDETMVDVERRRVQIHATSRADTAVGGYANEYILVAAMTEDGTKVREFWEFVDSAYTVEFNRRLMEAVAAQ